jgi:single stranded DNA-binding protein
MKALVQIEGRLDKNPETRELPRGRKVTGFSVAVNKKIRKNDETTTTVTDWYNVESWGYNATAAGRLQKGDAVFIEGELRTGSYTKGEVTISTTFVTVTRVRKLDYSIFDNNEVAEPEEADPGSEAADDPANF